MGAFSSISNCLSVYSAYLRSNWKLLTVLLCTYGFFKELKPSEAFLTPYIEQKNITSHQLSQSVYPFWTYSYLAFLFVFLPLTDLVRYKPMILLESVGYLGTRILLIWGTTVMHMQLMQVFYGLASATEVAYYSYIYALVTPDHYPVVNSFVRGIVLLGRSSAAYLGQILNDQEVLTYLQLNYFSLISVSIAAFLSLFLPMPVRKMRHASQEDLMRGNDQTSNSDFQPETLSLCEQLRTFVHDVSTIYKDRTILRWSVWWALATCGELQAGNYVQNLWEAIDKSSVKYGYVEATATLLGALAALCVGYIDLSWSIWGELLLGIVSTGDAFALYFMALSKNIYVAYGLWLVFRSTYALQITVATLQVAKRLRKERYGLVFGANMFIALALQTILTAICTARYSPLQLSIKTQFVVYGTYFFAIGSLFMAVGVYERTVEGWKNSWTRDRQYRDVVRDFGDVSLLDATVNHRSVNSHQNGLEDN